MSTIELQTSNNTIVFEHAYRMKDEIIRAFKTVPKSRTRYANLICDAIEDIDYDIEDIIKHTTACCTFFDAMLITFYKFKMFISFIDKYKRYVDTTCNALDVESIYKYAFDTTLDKMINNDINNRNIDIQRLPMDIIYDSGCYNMWVYINDIFNACVNHVNDSVNVVNDNVNNDFSTDIQKARDELNAYMLTIPLLHIDARLTTSIDKAVVPNPKIYNVINVNINTNTVCVTPTNIVV